MRRLWIILGIIPSLSGMVWPTVAKAAGMVPVFVSIVPQKYFVEKIGGKLADVSVMVEPGASPHNYEPKPRQMAALSKTKVYFAIGIEFENVWLEKIAAVNPNMLIIQTEAGIKKIPVKAHHRRGIKDPHVWLSPPLVMLQARNILGGFLAVDPAHRSIYEANYRKFIIEVVDLDAELRGILAGKGQKIEFMVFHPAWGYFAHAYGLEQVPVEIEGKDPKPAELQHLIEHARERAIRVVFVTPQFSTKSAEMVANAIGGQIASVDPLAEDWAKNLREVATEFTAVLR